MITMTQAAPLFTEDFSAGIDTNTWNLNSTVTPATDQFSTYTDTSDGQVSAVIVGNPRGAMLSLKQGFQRGDNLRVTLEFWLDRAQQNAYIGWRSLDTLGYPATLDDGGGGNYESANHIVGGTASGVYYFNDPVSDPAGWWWAAWNENQLEAPNAIGNIGIGLNNAYQVMFSEAWSPDSSGDIVESKRMKLQVWLGDTAGGTMYYGTADTPNGSLTQISGQEVGVPAGMTAPVYIDTRTYAAGTQVGGPSSPFCTVGIKDIRGSDCPVNGYGLPTADPAELIYLGFSLGDGTGNLHIANIVVENDSNLIPVEISGFKID
jgi:hypothetical protein